jgi:hypothetical protein
VEIIFLTPAPLVTRTKSIACIFTLLKNQYLQTPILPLFWPKKALFWLKKAAFLRLFKARSSAGIQLRIPASKG